MLENNILGNWAVLDIETTGLNPGVDDIIDIGFLKFNGLELVEKYSSLIHYDKALPEFIKQLTSIQEKELLLAPELDEVLYKLDELSAYSLIAHNSDFEKSFLENYLEDVEYVDSLCLLPILNPFISNLKLETWLIYYDLSNKEIHRGFEDSLDLLKVILLTSFEAKQDKYRASFLTRAFQKFVPNTFWQKFLDLEIDDLIYIANQIDFDLESALNNFHIKQTEKMEISKIEGYSGKLDFSSQSIVTLLQDEKYFSKIFEGYKVRDQQLAMSKRVGQTFKHKLHALVEAPTGTGKTLGYLIPAVLNISENKSSSGVIDQDTTKKTKKINDKDVVVNEHQVVIATATKALQTQIIQKDMPILKQIVKKKFNLNYIKLIGTNNHFCRLSFDQFDNEQLNLFSDEAENWPKLYFENLFYFASYNKFLSADDIPYLLAKKYKNFNKIKAELQVDYRRCIKHSCPHKDYCSYVKGIEEAKDADVVIVNHALLFSWPKALPLPQKVIVDEAHKIEKSVTSSFTKEFLFSDFAQIKALLVDGSNSIGSLKYLLTVLMDKVDDDLNTKIRDFNERLNDHVMSLDKSIESFFKEQIKYSELYWNEKEFFIPQDESNNNSNTLLLEIFFSVQSLQFIFTSLEEYFATFDILKDLVNQSKSNNNEKNLDQNYLIAWNNVEYMFDKILDASKFFTDMIGEQKVKKEEEKEEEKEKQDQNEYVRTICYHAKEGFKFVIQPVDCGKILFENVLSKIQTSVFTSATIGIGNSDRAPLGVQWSTGQLFLTSKKRFRKDLSLPPLFDYYNNAQVYICSDVPYFGDENFVSDIMNKIMPFINHLGGKSLLLFSSKIRFNKACEFLLSQASHLNVFIQGMGSNIVNDFISTNSGVLLGLESFGEGIDIQGDKLKFVLIDKIPDLRFDLIIKRRREFFQQNFGNEFQDYFMANRERMLLQKMGRLIRSESDKGGIIIIDCRISRWKNFTLNKFVKNLFPYNVVQSSLQNAVDRLIEFIPSNDI